MAGFVDTAYTAVSVATAHRGRGGHMRDDGAEWMWFVGPIAMTLWLALLVLLVWWIATLVNRRSHPASTFSRTEPGAPEEVVAMRFAQGEIGVDEYRKVLVNLRERHDAGA